jgi:phosphate transport system substrate-binding protein
MQTWMRMATLAAVFVAATAARGQGIEDLTGKVEIDGSSTVAPLTIKAADLFHELCPNVSVPVMVSGTGGGFKRFTKGETDISDASRPIKAAELASARQNGVAFIELPIAYDGLTVVVHRSNDFCDQLTIAQLKKIFCADQAARRWSDVDPRWPNREIQIFSPGTDSGTFDYFKEVVAGDGAIRDDISVSEDDNQLVLGVSQTPDAIGFFGIAYYRENENKLKAVSIVNPQTNEAIAPTSQAIETGQYAPLSRPLFLYVNAKSARRPEVRLFITEYLKHADQIAADVGYVALPAEIYESARAVFQKRATGTCFLDEAGATRHGPLAEVYQDAHRRD